MSTYATKFRGEVPTLGRTAWLVLYDALMNDKATTITRCKCGKLVCFTTDGDGHLVALEAVSRERHECEE